MPIPSLLDVAGYAAANGYAEEVWPVACTCRVGYYGDGSETSQLLLRALAKRATTTTDDEEEGQMLRSRLAWAARRGDTSRLKILLRAGADARGAAAIAALCEAVQGGHVDAASTLLEAGVDADGVARYFTDVGPIEAQPLFFAARGVDPRGTVPLLLEAGAGTTLLQSRDDYLGTALEVAASVSETSVLPLLLPLYDGPEHVDSRSQAFQVACIYRRLPALTLLLDADSVELGRSPVASAALATAARAGWADGVRLLLAHGTDARPVYHDLETALHALDGTPEECREIASLLLDAGVDLEASIHGGNTPLMAACQRGAAAAVRELLRRGADASAVQRSFNQNCLHLWAGRPLERADAADAGEVASALVAAGADVNLRDRYLLATPLHMAAERGDAVLAPALLANGANPLLLDAEGRTPLQVAQTALAGVDGDDPEAAATKARHGAVVAVLEAAEPRQ
jgi:ankyrin repeat protein